MKNWNTVRLVGPDKQDGSSGETEWEVRLPLAGMTVEQSRGAAEVLLRLCDAGSNGTKALAAIGLVPDIQEYQRKILLAIESTPVPKPNLPLKRDIPQFVSLLQMSAIIQKSKRTLEKMKGRVLPPPDIQGGGGKADQWEWETVRPILENYSGMRLPVHFPVLRDMG